MHEGWLASTYKSQNSFALSPIDLGEIAAPSEFVSCIIAAGRTAIRATKARGSERRQCPFFLSLLHFFFKK